jgi:hypothetical protein
MEPPPVRNKRTTARARLNSPVRYNKHGLVVPSRDPKNLELNENALLVNLGSLPGSTKFNYRNYAKNKATFNWEKYLKNAEEANAKTRKNKGKNNGKNKNTRRNGNYNPNDPRVKLGF